MNYFLLQQNNECKDKLIKICDAILNRQLTNCDLNKDLEQIGFDSIKFIELIVSIEESFKIKFPDDCLVFSKIKSINALIDIVQKNI